MTIHDMDECLAVHESLQVPCSFCDVPCDCQDSETVMLSTGYADVWKSGEVVQRGASVWMVGDTPQRGSDGVL